MAEVVTELDLTDEAPEEPGLTRPGLRPFDPEPQRERLRGWIALGLLAMFALVLLCSFISLWAGIDGDKLQTVLTILVGPLVALVSAATGFYYGSRADAPRPNGPPLPRGS
jgi:hypothetical protein